MQKTLTCLVAVIGLASVVSAGSINTAEIHARKNIVMASAASRAEKLGLRSGAIQQDTIDPSQMNDLVGCIRGFAYGLQYDPKRPGNCYYSISDSLDILDQITQLSSKFYNPLNWGPTMQAMNDFTIISSSVNADCSFDKLINSITDSVGEGSSKFIARAAAGSVNEIPNALTKFLGGQFCFNKMKAAGNLAQTLFLYSI